MRFLFLCLLIYLGYRMVKGIMAPGPGRPPTGPDERTGEDFAPIDDIMVKDPYCDTYFPKRNGVKAVVEGETHFFCSDKCRDAYLEQRRKASESGPSET